MPLVACFLRAVNVGGRRVTNVALRHALEDVGFTAVATYQAAGNLVLDPGARDHAAVAAAVEAALSHALGFTTETLVRAPHHVRAIVDEVPWTDSQVAAAAGKPQVALLRDLPDPAVAARAAAMATADDLFELRGTELHWLPLAGVGRTTVDAATLQRLLHPMTVRTIGTLERLHARLLRG